MRAFTVALEPQSQMVLISVMESASSNSRRLFELADSITEIKTICDCGSKATVNARLSDGRVVTEGEQVLLGGNDSYVAMCHACWKKRIAAEKRIRL